MSETPSLPSWSCSVSVRSLCEFTAKRGDLDRRFTPSATALEGLAGQAAVVARRGAGYESEVPLEATSGVLRVRGRADGFDPARQCLEEIKTIRGHPDDIPENRRALHWAQLETYGALLCRERGLAEVQLALVYVDAGTQAETVLQQPGDAAALDAAFEARCRSYIDWALQEAAHRRARDAALGALEFPPGAFRPGQRALAETVYRAATAGRCLLAQAPTGIGKTLGTLYPLLRAMPGQQIDRIGYLTCKGTGRITALDALQRLRDGTPGKALRVQALVAKEQACEHPDKACHGDACPLAQGFYERLPAARAEAAGEGWLDPAAQRRIALQHRICPYYLGQEMLRWVDVVVGDVHHAFDPNGQLFGLAQALDWRLALLVDEAHNLVDRARAMYSASLGLAQVRAAMRHAPAALRPRFGRLAKAIADAAAAQDDDHAAHDSVPEALGDALLALNAAIGDHLQSQPLAHGPLVEFYFEALALQRLCDKFDTHSLFDIARSQVPATQDTPLRRGRGQVRLEVREAQALPLNLSLLDDEAPAEGVALATHAGAFAHGGDAIDAEPDPGSDDTDAVVSVRNVVPATFLRPRFAACHSATLFSATLGPPSYQTDLLGLPEDTAWIDVPPAFAPEHLTVQIADRVSTRFPHRQASLDAVVDLMARQFAAHPGNYLAFFSSFDYLEQAAQRLAQRHPGLPQWRQSRAMGELARRDFLARFVPQGEGLGFAVLGGAFAEGVDLPGTRLIGAFIATLGLPPVSKVQEQFKARLDTIFGAGHGYADLVPGLQKVVQAAGRVIRTPEDRGWLWLMDGRYRRPEVRALLPGWWCIAPAA
jgi:DNA excision repair protein ERCC-2